jgi:F0F1-type ATP synthase membrane subunit b/b'
MKLEIALLLIMGFKPKQIAELMDIKQSNIYHYVDELEKAKERANQKLSELLTSKEKAKEVLKGLK